MIGKITGRIDYVAADHALIETAGVGYVVHCAPGTLSRLPGPGAEAALYTDLLVREDLMQLVGFQSLAEREWHRLLTSVQGVGAKVALGIVDALGPDGVSRALALGDVAAVRRAPGVGPKLAARIVNELKDRAAGIMALGAQAGRAGGASSAPALSAPQAPGGAPEAASDAISALVNLGYDRGEAAAAVAGAVSGAGAGAGAEPAPGGAQADAADLIRAALKRLAPDV